MLKCSTLAITTQSVKAITDLLIERNESKPIVRLSPALQISLHGFNHRAVLSFICVYSLLLKERKKHNFSFELVHSLLAGKSCVEEIPR